MRLRSRSRIEELAHILNQYIAMETSSFNEVDAARVLRGLHVLRFKGSVYSENADHVAQLLETGKAVIGNETYWLFIDLQILSKLQSPLPIYKVERTKDGGSIDILTGVTHGLLAEKFLDYLNVNYPQGSSRTGRYNVETQEKKEVT